MVTALALGLEDQFYNDSQLLGDWNQLLHDFCYATALYLATKSLVEEDDLKKNYCLKKFYENKKINFIVLVLVSLK